MWQQYIIPATLDETLDLLANHLGSARIVAGGTDIVVEIDRGVADILDRRGTDRTPRGPPRRAPEQRAARFRILVELAERLHGYMFG